MDAREKSFDAASESSKLLITLSTGAVGVGLAVLNVEAGKATALTPLIEIHKAVIAISLAAFVVSAACGIWTQLGITEVLSQDVAEDRLDVWDKRITRPMQLQIVGFLLGLVLIVGYGVLRLAA